METTAKVEAGFKVGECVAVHPAHDAFMQGDRYGVVVGHGRAIPYVDRFDRTITHTRPVRVKMDRSGRTLRFHPTNLSAV